MLRRLGLTLVGAAIAASSWMIGTAMADDQNEQFMPLLVYRSGPYAPNGIPFADGQADYLALLNARDGGINKVKIASEECDTQYNNDRGVECYERLKHKGPTGAALFSPLSTGITYALIERAAQDKIPVLSMGYGRTDAADGRVFPWIFPAVATYWSNADALIQYVAQKEGGIDKLKGKKIALVYIDIAYGKEPIPVLEALSKKYGFVFDKFPVAAPGIEQKSTWLQLARQTKPDWTFLWGWGVMNSTAIKEAAAVGYPRDHFIGVWWSGAEPDVVPAGEGAVGYESSSFHAAGQNFAVIQDILKYVYGSGQGKTTKEKVGEVLYNRGVINGLLATEAIRTAMNKYGNKPMTGEQVRWGLENLNLTEARLKQLGFDGLMTPFHLSCADHEGGGKIKIQQWDGKTWKFVSDWITPDKSVVRPMIEESAAQYAKEKGITPRDCSKES
ncbi:MAG TPA: ABC transporter substrate-binding protein [Candidatus Cybelea sp.]|nr:ABC transporter substrate-binding protein [Candidatus Cybelea sp.]